jgi:hypothetical protein
MMSPYGEFLVDFERKHGDHTHRNDPGNTKAAIIVETRPLFFLPKVIRNVMYFLGPDWNLYVLTAGATVEFLHRSLPGWQVPIGRLPEAILTPIGGLELDTYTRLLCSPEFWRRFGEDKVLTFQTDTLLTGPRVGEYLGYDYIGAPCQLTQTGDCVLNGGLALRTRQLMLDCLVGARPAPDQPEDAFFTRRVRELGGTVPDFATAARFSIESHFVVQPLGVHGTDKFYHSIEMAERIVRAIEY